MTIEPGVFVRHASQLSWGTGRVLELLPPEKVRIRFANAGEKMLVLHLAQLESATPSPSEEKFLTGPGPRPRRPNATAKPHEALVAAFLRKYPGGFGSTAFHEGEREYKVKAHELAVLELSAARLGAALAAGHFDDIVNAALHVLNATNLVFPNEKMALSDGLDSPAAREKFSRRLVDLLHGSESYQVRFEAFADFLLEVNAAKWTGATYFPFILCPRDHMFLKPEVTQKAADAYGFWLAYDPHLNWNTYDRLLAFAKLLEERLAPLEPVDMLDIQSFLWVAGTEE